MTASPLSSGQMLSGLKSALSVPETLEPLLETTMLEVSRTLRIPIAPGFIWSAIIRIKDFASEASWRGDEPDRRKYEDPVDVRGYPSLYAEDHWEGQPVNDFKHVGITCWDFDFARDRGAELPEMAEIDRLLLADHFEAMVSAQVNGFYGRGGKEPDTEFRALYLDHLVTRWQSGALLAENFRILTDDGDLFDGRGRLIGMDFRIRSTGELRKIREAVGPDRFEAFLERGVILNGPSGGSLARAHAPKLRERLDAALADEGRSAGVNFRPDIHLETYATFLAERPEMRPFWRSCRRDLGGNVMIDLLAREMDRREAGAKPDVSPAAG